MQAIRQLVFNVVGYRSLYHFFTTAGAKQCEGNN